MTSVITAAVLIVAAVGCGAQPAVGTKFAGDLVIECRNVPHRDPVIVSRRQLRVDGDAAQLVVRITDLNLGDPGIGLTGVIVGPAGEDLAVLISDEHGVMPFTSAPAGRHPFVIYAGDATSRFEVELVPGEQTELVLQLDTLPPCD